MRESLDTTPTPDEIAGVIELRLRREVARSRDEVVALKAELARLARERDYCRERWTLAVIDWLRTRPGSVAGEADIRARAEKIVAFALADVGQGYQATRDFRVDQS